MLAACTLTRTCPAATSGSATSFSGILSMVSYCSTTTAFILIPDASSFGRSIASLPVAASAAPLVWGITVLCSNDRNPFIRDQQSYGVFDAVSLFLDDRGTGRI